jgi:hypothetical protein
LIEEGYGPDGRLTGPLKTLMEEANNYSNLSEIGQMKWLNDIENLMAAAITWREDSSKVMSSLFGGEEVTFTTADGKTVSGVVKEDGSIEADGYTYKDVTWYGGTDFRTKEKFQEEKIEEKEKDSEKSAEPEEKKYRYVYFVSELGI